MIKCYLEYIVLPWIWGDISPMRCVCIYVCMYVCMYVCIYICIYMYTYIYIIVYIYIFIYSFLFIHSFVYSHVHFPQAFATTSLPGRCVVPLSTLHQNSSIAKVMGRQWIGHLAAPGAWSVLICATYFVLCDICSWHAGYTYWKCTEVHDMDVKSLEMQMYIYAI